MKSKKLFGIIIFLNFFSSATFMGIILYHNFVEQSRVADPIPLIVLASIFFIVIFPFNWICYSLYKSYKLNQQLLKREKITGGILCILFSLLAIVEIIGMIDIIPEASFEISYKSVRFFVLFSTFFLITITSLYLCVAYWIVRRQTKTHFVDIVAELGNES